MSEKEHRGQIRFSYGISLRQAVSKSLGVILVFGLLVILGDLLSLAGSSVPLISLILLVFICINMLGYIELSVSSPRKGGAYRLVQACEDGNWLAFLTGWSLILAGISAAGTLILAFAHQGTTLARSIFDLSIPELGLAAALLISVFIYRSIPFKKSRQGYLLITLLAVIIISSLAALPNFQLENLSPFSGDWKITFTLLSISFIGLEIASSSQSELRNHSRNGPRLFIITSLAAGFLIALAGTISLGVTGTGGYAGGVNPLADLGLVWGGKWFSAALAGLSLAAIPIALNRIFSTLTRQVFAMTRDGFWPEIMLKTNQRTKTPLFILLALAGFTSLTLFVPITYLARLGGFFYLVVLMGVNFTLIKREQISSSFQLPIHPWVPALVLVVDLLVSFAWAEILPAAGLLLSAGMIIFILYGRHHCVKAKEGITVFKSDVEEETTKQHTRILVPIANPETAESLLRLAGTLVRPEGG